MKDNIGNMSREDQLKRRYSIAEVAEEMNISKSLVHKIEQRLLRKLRVRFERIGYSKTDIEEI